MTHESFQLVTIVGVKLTGTFEKTRSESAHWRGMLAMLRESTHLHIWVRSGRSIWKVEFGVDLGPKICQNQEIEPETLSRQSLLLLGIESNRHGVFVVVKVWAASGGCSF